MSASSETVLEQALACHRAGRLADAEKLYRVAQAEKPADAAINAYLGVLLHQSGRVADSIPFYQRAVAADPAGVETQMNLAGALLALGKPDAAAIAFRAVLKQDENHMAALSNYSELLTQLGRPEQALPLRRRLVAITPGDINNEVILANALSQAGKYEEAEGIYRQALAAAPDNAVLHVNLGNVLNVQDRPQEALVCQEAALALDPENPLVFLNLGNAYIQLERFDEAIAAYNKVLALNPHYPKVRGNLALALCRAGRLDESMAIFGALGAAAPTQRAMAHKARHDAEQREYLKIVRVPTDGARVAGPAVNPANGEAVNAQWRQANLKIATIDNLLTPAALESLRDYCLAAPVWKMPYENGYLGAMPDFGFGAPIIAQIAEELRSVFPALFQDHPLYYFWGYKYDSRLKGINIHGDDAAVNVNFWLTPDEANRDPDSGGLVVWDVAVPKAWNFDKFNGDKTAIYDYLKREGAKPITVPHRRNRAVIFQSDLFHETDRIAFAEGYTNRRINITMLFGRRQF